MECPFCDLALGCDDDLLQHLFRCHPHEEVLGRKLYALACAGGSGAFWASCYCGRLFTSYSGTCSLLEHWRKKGGLTAHILELALGSCQEALWHMQARTSS